MLSTADKNSRVGQQVVHPNPVAQHRTAAKRAGGIHCDNTHPFVFRAKSTGKFRGQGAFSRAGRSGDAQALFPDCIPEIILSTLSGTFAFIWQLL